MRQRTIVGYLHSLCGGGFFLILAFYSLFHFPNTRPQYTEREPHERERDFVYRTSGIVILLSTIAMGVYLFLLPKQWQTTADEYNALFWLEWVALWAFAAAWLTKGRMILADVAIDLLAFTHQRLLPGKRNQPKKTNSRTVD